jgi:ubiquinol-cytochrome c reductase cytochrome b subunit
MAAEHEHLVDGVETGEVRQSVQGGYEGEHRPLPTRRPGAPLSPVGRRTGTPAPEHPEPAPRRR